MATGDGGDWSSATRTVSVRPERPDDVDSARRGAASFGSGVGPTFGERLREFIRRYGWRAYALPILVIVTVVALATAHDPAKAPAQPAAGGASAGGQAVAPPVSHTHGASTPPNAPDSMSVKSDDTGGITAAEAATNGKLPAGPAYTKDGDGTFRVLPGTSKVVGKTGQLFKYDIEVENGVKGVDLNAFAALVESTLANRKSWSGHGVRLQRVPAADAQFRVTLTSSMTVRQFCGYDIPVETSCYATAGAAAGLDANRVVFNVARYVRGAGAYVGDLAAYRHYMINHEVGHALGHQHAHQCLLDGLAPVMMQQTIGLKDANTGKYCAANAWPYPPGVKGTPGAEQADTNSNSEYTND